MRSVLVVGLVLMAGCTAPADTGVWTSGHPLEGHAAPEYAAEAITGNGTLPDGLVLLTVWASWCTVCAADEPSWVDLQEEFGDRGLSILAVSHEADRQAAQDHVARMGWTFATAWDPDVNTAWGLWESQPNYVLVQDHTVVSVREGSMLGRPGGMERWRADIGALLG